MGAFIGVDCLKIHNMSDDVIFVRDTVAAVHVARAACYVQRLAARIALNQRDRLGRELAIVEQLSSAQAGLQADSDFGLHVSEFFLN